MFDEYMEKREKTWLKIISAEVERRVSDAIERVIKREAVFCYTEKEAAALLGFKDAQTLARTRKEGFIKHSRIAGGSIRYTPDQLQEFLQRNEYPQRKKKLRTVK